MTLGEYMRKVDAEIQQEIETFLNVQIAASAVAFIDSRVRGTGTKADGGKFSPYSTKPSLIGATSFTSKTHADKVFGKTKNKDLDWVTYQGHKLAIMPGGYKQIRETEGRQTAYKDFERTSELWRSIHIEGKPIDVNTNQVSPGRFRTTIGTKNPRSIKIMEGIADRENTDFLALSDSEAQKLADFLGNKLAQIMS
jgi:hypothetical protein